MKRTYSSLLVVATLVALLLTPSHASAQAPALGSSGSFAVLAGSTVTNTGATTVTGDVGVSPGAAITGFSPGSVTGGTIHAGDAVAMQAQSDVTSAYNGLAGLACNTDLTGQNLGGLTLTPGVYCFSSSAALTGTLTLDAQGNPNAEFIFKIGSNLATAASSSVLLINGGQDCKVYWQVGNSASIGAAAAFKGNLLALGGITAMTGASVSGRLLARNGAVTMDTNTVAICPPGIKGDANGDGAATVGDVFYLINSLFGGGPAPIGPADANGDSQITVGDIFYLINFLFSGGPPPV